MTDLTKDNAPTQLVVEVRVSTEGNGVHHEVYGYDLSRIEDTMWHNGMLTIAFHDGHAQHHPIHTIQQAYTV